MQRLLYLIPVAYIADSHGFMLFASYAAFCMTVLHLQRYRTRAATVRA